MDKNMKINLQNYKFILWGHKLHSHTHSYIHNAFFRAFQHLGASTFWFDDNDDVSGFDFSNSLFITEGQVDKKIPLRNDCFYVLHNCYDDKYQELFANGNCINLQVYTDAVLQYNYTKLSDCIYADYAGKCVYFPWATDLLPDEIEKNKPSYVFNETSKIVNWIGTVGAGKFGNIDQILPFKRACEDNRINFSSILCAVSIEDNIQLIKKSYLAPTIVGEWQHKVGYIPCRIFKNISYGQMGLTNSPRVYELFNKKIIYNSNTEHLFWDAVKHMKKMPLAELHSLMDFVRDNHTYINRISVLLNFIEKVKT
jgi:hypothetical protein